MGKVDPGWTFGEADLRLVEELQEFLPRRVFDAHAHVWRTPEFDPGSEFFSRGPQQGTLDHWREHLRRVFPSAELAGGLFMPMCAPRGEDALERLHLSNEFLLEQLRAWPEAAGLLFIAPQCPPERIEPLLENDRVAGFKPYHLWSDVKPTWQAPPSAYLPEWAWEMAHRRGLVITLHLVREGAVADPENLREIRRMCERYPKARLVLAHAGRSFHGPNAARGVPALRGLENVWFDISGICEAEPLLAILGQFGTKRLLWGSDFPVSAMRGRCVTVGDGFAWVQYDTLNWQSGHVRANPVLVGLESLRALRQAAAEFGLNRQDLEDIFCDNAKALLGKERRTANLGQDLYVHAKRRIPGGTQLLSKRPEMYAPQHWPPYFREARGCEVWDLDGRRYYDMSNNSVGACLLGYADPDVNAAVRRRVNLGNISSLNCAEEVAVADRLCEIHPWAEQVRFARGGGEAVAVAVRIARATTDRSLVAVCGYHGWHDWYLAANLGESDALRGHLLPGLDPMGVPVELRGTTLTFPYNDRKALQKILDAHGDRLAAVVMEPCRRHDPEPGFLEFVRDEAHRHGALLIFDEVSIGFRLTYGGSHLRFGVNPDMAVFAKALGNGYPIGAVIGTRQAMEGAHGSFISSTYWTEAVGYAAALATLEKMKRIDVPAHVARIGRQVQAHWREAARRHGLAVEVPDHYPCFAQFNFIHDKARELYTLYTRWMLEHGFLAWHTIYPTLAHTDEVVSRYAEAIDSVFGRIAEVLAGDRVDEEVGGLTAHAGFRRLI